MSVQLQLCPDIMSEHLKKVIVRTGSEGQRLYISVYNGSQSYWLPIIGF